MIIMNRGSCPRKSIELIGVSSKRGDSSQVGQFGSGTSFAVALLLRTGLKLEISSSDEKGPYTMEPWQNSEGRIYWRFRPGVSLIKSWWNTLSSALGSAYSRPTSFTVGFGEIDWKGEWPVIREFVTNARDADPNGYWVTENEEDVERFYKNAIDTGYDSVTVVRITGDYDFNLEYWSEFFMFEPPSNLDVHMLKDVYRANPLEAIMEKGPSTVVELFVKGVRVEHGIKQESMFSWSLNADLTEARTLKHDFTFRYSAARMLEDAFEKFPGLAAEVIDFVSRNHDSFEANLPMTYTLGDPSKWTGILTGKTVNVKGSKADIIMPVNWVEFLNERTDSVKRRPLSAGVGQTIWSDKSARDVAIDLIVNELWRIRPDHPKIIKPITLTQLYALCTELDIDWDDFKELRPKGT